MSLVYSALGRHPRGIRYTFAICTLITVCWVPVRVVLRFTDAWRRIEEQASETRQEKRMEKETGNASAVPKIAVGLTD